MTLCEHWQQRLAEQGSAALQNDPGGAAHLAGCAGCRAFLAALETLDQTLPELPGHDAPPALLARTAAATGRAVRPVIGRRRRWAIAVSGLAAALAALVVAPLWLQMLPLQRLAPPADNSGAVSTIEPASNEAAQTSFYRGGGEGDAERSRHPLSLSEQNKRLAGAGADLIGDLLTANSLQPPPLPELRFDTPEDGLSEALGDERGGGRKTAELTAELAREAQQPGRAGERGAAIQSGIQTVPNDVLNARRIPQPGTALPRSDHPRPQFAKENRPASADNGAFADQQRAAHDAPVVAGQIEAEPEEKPNAERFDQDADGDRQRRNQPAPIRVPAQRLGAAPVALADAFLRRRESLDVATQPATGYWANTYLPGDPALRRLETLLQTWDRGPLRAASRIEPLLERRSVQYRQPFDPPQDAALALYLHADRPALAGRSRLRVQVGLKGALRQGGRRPAMNVAVLLDLRAADRAALDPRLQALLTALAAARQPGDRFSLSAAGSGGGLLLTAEQFRHGPLTVALRELAKPGAGASLSQALAAAGAELRRHAVADAPLGSSLVLLVAASPDALPAELETAVHRNALEGIHFSAVTLGGQAPGQTLQQLVLSGQGNLRNLPTPAAAGSLVDAELYAASRAVARALRLRIRLAPGVELVEVLGSQRLGERQTQRVREQERSIDRRLARNLGIRADRGADEQGIQIVIPQFYAADEHVILLDLIAAGPGPIADVTLRYKDLLLLRNGVASAALALGRDTRPAGPLERNVVKNHLAVLLARAARRAGSLLAAGDNLAAAAILTALRELWRDLPRAIPAWAADPELLDDQALLDDYLAVLRSGIAGDTLQRQRLSASLWLAAARKLSTPNIDTVPR